MGITLTPIEPGSQRVKGTDLLFLQDYDGRWSLLCRGEELRRPFDSLAEGREWLDEIADELDRRDT